MIVCIHQPNYLPWLGFFHKIELCDTFVYLDDVQYSPKTWTNRAYICRENDLARLTMPTKVPHWDAPINRVIVQPDTFRHKHLNSIYHAYRKCQCFDEVYSILEPHYNSEERTLADFNIPIIEKICAYLDLKTVFVKSSSLQLSSKKNELLIDIVKGVGGTCFVSGTGAKTYITGNETHYSEKSVALAYQNFKHPQYQQNSNKFVENASVIDALFNLGPATRDLFKVSDPAYIYA